MVPDQTAGCRASCMQRLVTSGVPHLSVHVCSNAGKHCHRSFATFSGHSRLLLLALVLLCCSTPRPTNQRRIRLPSGACVDLAYDRPDGKVDAPRADTSDPILVAVTVAVSESGLVTETSIDEIVDLNAAIAVKTAAMRWRFTPITVKGKPVAMECTLVFRLTPSGWLTATDGAWRSRK